MSISTRIRRYSATSRDFFAHHEKYVKNIEKKQKENILSIDEQKTYTNVEFIVHCIKVSRSLTGILSSDVLDKMCQALNKYFSIDVTEPDYTESLNTDKELWLTALEAYQSSNLAADGTKISSRYKIDKNSKRQEADSKRMSAAYMAKKSHRIARENTRSYSRSGLFWFACSLILSVALVVFLAKSLNLADMMLAFKTFNSASFYYIVGAKICIVALLVILTSLFLRIFNTEPRNATNTTSERR